MSRYEQDERRQGFKKLERPVQCIGCGMLGHRKYQCRNEKPKQIGAVAAIKKNQEYEKVEDSALPCLLQKDENEFEHFIVEGTVGTEED